MKKIFWYNIQHNTNASSSPECNNSQIWRLNNKTDWFLVYFTSPSSFNTFTSHFLSTLHSLEWIRKWTRFIFMSLYPRIYQEMAQSTGRMCTFPLYCGMIKTEKLCTKHYIGKRVILLPKYNWPLILQLCKQKLSRN